MVKIISTCFRPNLYYGNYQTLVVSQSHWDKIYDTKPMEKLGWYQKSPQPDLDTILSLGLPNNARILVVGVGRSNIVKSLINHGYDNLICTDISQSALEKLENDIGHTPIKLIQDNLGNPEILTEIEPVDLWYDRAVLHFLTHKSDRVSYKNLLKKLVKLNGHVLLAQFSTEGAKKCSGLDVLQYNIDLYRDLLGKDFRQKKAFEHTYIMPSGDSRPYIYAVFEKLD